jgi:hypothetical protein
LADEAVVWVFVGFLIGLPSGLILGYIAAQIVQPKAKASTVILQKTENGYVIRES